MGHGPVVSGSWLVVSGSWLIAFGDVVHRYASPYRGGGLKGRRGWFVVGALMGAPVADRRPQVAKPCHIDPLSIWSTIRGGPPFRTAPTMAPAGAFFKFVAAQRHP